MECNYRSAIAHEIEKFHLPTYNEIPNVGLFLEQTTKYISEYLEPLDEISLTGSMISNYVKKKILQSPVKKQYNREQIAYLFFIAIAKSVLSLEDIQLTLQLQKENYDAPQAYEYFRQELLNALLHVSGNNVSLKALSPEVSDEKTLLRNTVITVANKVYLDKYFKLLRYKE